MTPIQEEQHPKKRNNNFVQAAKELFIDDSAPGGTVPSRSVSPAMAEERVPYRPAGDYSYEYEKSGGYPASQKDVTVIGNGTVIRGSISTEGHLDIQGRVEGDISAQGGVRISGQVLGNVSGDSIELVNTRLKGNLTATTKVDIDRQSVVVGDVSSNILIFDGKLKGDVNTEGTVTLSHNAYLLGNITAKTVSMENGAAVNGVIRITQSVLEDAAFDI